MSQPAMPFVGSGAGSDAGSGAGSGAGTGAMPTMLWIGFS